MCIGARANGDVGAAIDRDRKDLAAIVIGMLANDVHPAGRGPDDVGVTVEYLSKVVARIRGVHVLFTLDTILERQERAHERGIATLLEETPPE
jgi:hypothetical protein